MDLILVPIGSAGDVHPFIGLGVGLRSRGHRVTVLVNEHFRRCVESAGLEFAPLGAEEDFLRMIEDPLLWHPTRGFEFVTRKGFLPLIPFLYEELRLRHNPGNTGVIASSMAFGARIAQDKLGIPVVSVHLQPAIFPSLYDTPEYGGLAWLARLPKPLKTLLLAGVDWATDRIAAPEINRFRASVGLGPVRSVLKEWIHSPIGSVGLFPDWFAAPQPDWPAKTRLTGFPLFDERGNRPAPPEVLKFLAEGEPPIAFTAGSAMRQAKSLFAVSAEACRRLGRRGLLLTQHLEQIPASLPDGVLAASYAPFSQVFPKCAAVVHHGGIGTTAQALAAGTPQLVAPFAHDQFDNARRVERLGVGTCLFAGRYKLPAVIGKLRLLLENENYAQRAREIAPLLQGARTVLDTCDHILSLLVAATSTPE